MKSNNAARAVKSQNQASLNLNNLQSSGNTRLQKAQLRSRERMQRVAFTQARKYLLYALGCILASQLVKFMITSVVYRGESTPTGIFFLGIVYLQMGLLLATFVFFVLAIFKTLQRLLTEEI